VDDPYERPPRPELVLKTADMDVGACVEMCMVMLAKAGILKD